MSKWFSDSNFPAQTSIFVSSKKLGYKFFNWKLTLYDLIILNQDRRCPYIFLQGEFDFNFPYFDGVFYHKKQKLRDTFRVNDLAYKSTSKFK